VALPRTRPAVGGGPPATATASELPSGLHANAVQGLTIVHFSAQLKRYLWDRGYMLGLFMGCLWGVRGC
jgi:hypothetical protein